MTDVLEQLLKEEEEDENEWAFPRIPAGTAELARETLESENMHDVQGESDSKADWPEVGKSTKSVDERAARIVDAARIRQEAVWSISDRMTRLHKAAQRHERRNGHPERNAGPVSGREPFLIRSAAQQTAHTTDFAALVDTAFARDARRYDGPLKLL